MRETRETIETIKCNLERRSFLREICAAAAAAGIFGIGLRADALTSSVLADGPGTHNMLVIGERAAYLSHLPMFNKLNQAKTSYLTLHRYQVLLEATFNGGSKDLSSIYTEDRVKNQAVKMYTLQPEEFVLPRLIKSAAARSPLSSFKGTVFRGHLERGGQPINQLEDITVNIKRVIHFRQFDPKAKKPSLLEYLLFGQPEELFLTHFISKPPDFDQTLSVKIAGHDFTEAELSQGVRVNIAGRPDTAQERIKEEQEVEGEALLGEARSQKPLKLQITAGREFYFEEGELLLPPTFDPTGEEKSSGFDS
ncbi:MAG TPA: twin-arginine translocation signal domain-containing protein [Pyrinomonadaceae bacterium]|jgi:hypothetical protein